MKGAKTYHIFYSFKPLLFILHIVLRFYGIENMPEKYALKYKKASQKNKSLFFIFESISYYSESLIRPFLEIQNHVMG